jgi:aryl-alcohol dehydrogenase-like predicted oxidoreductase
MAEFVLGSVQLGLPYGAANRTGQPSREAAISLVRRAHACGIRTFDTARAYGSAEERLGEALPGALFFVVTKLSPLGDLPDQALPAAAVAAAEASVAQSCAALKTDRLDCLLLHRAVHRTMFGGAIWQRLLDFVAAGIIGKLGVSVQSTAEAADALACPEVQHIQMPFNLLDWRWREAGIVAALTKRPDVAVHVRSVFLQGLLAAGDPAIWPQISGVDQFVLLAKLDHLVRELHRDGAADLCMAYSRGQKFIAGVVIGLETEAQLDENLRLMGRPPLTSAECRLVENSLPHVPEQLLNPALWPKK